MNGKESQYGNLVRGVPYLINLNIIRPETVFKGMYKPFDKIVSNVMESTALELCSKIPNCTLGFIHRYCIMLVVHPGDSSSTNVTFLISRAASYASVIFNRIWRELIEYSFLDYYDFSAPDFTVTKSKYFRVGGKVLFNCTCFNMIPRFIGGCLAECQRENYNSVVNDISSVYLTNKERNKAPGTKKKIVLLRGKGIDVDRYPRNLVYGSKILNKSEGEDSKKDYWELVSESGMMVLTDHLPDVKKGVTKEFTPSSNEVKSIVNIKKDADK